MSRSRSTDEKTMSFTLHWSPVNTLERAESSPDGLTLLALWPAPVNPDVCFQKAGVTDFGNNDLAWDAQASELLERLLVTLQTYGSAQLVSTPLVNALPWYLRPFKTPAVKSIREQIEWPMQWDSLPQCQVVFGSSGATLRTGRGHHLFWITLPEVNKAAIEKFIARVAAKVPVKETCLNWAPLL